MGSERGADRELPTETEGAPVPGMCALAHAGHERRRSARLAVGMGPRWLRHRACHPLSAERVGERRANQLFPERSEPALL